MEIGSAGALGGPARNAVIGNADRIGIRARRRISKEQSFSPVGTHKPAPRRSPIKRCLRSFSFEPFLTERLDGWRRSNGALRFVCRRDRRSPAAFDRG